MFFYALALTVLFRVFRQGCMSPITPSFLQSTDNGNPHETLQPFDDGDPSSHNKPLQNAWVNVTELGQISTADGSVASQA